MNQEDLELLRKEKFSDLSESERIERDLYLKELLDGKIQGPLVGYSSIDKPWLKFYDNEAIKTDMPKMTCYEYLKSCNENYLDRIALSYFGRKFTFSQLFEKIDQTANSLLNLGLKKGDIVTISLPNIPEAVYLFYACSKIGVIANMVDPRTSEEGIHHYIEEVDSKYVFMIDSYFFKIKKLLKNKQIDKAIVVSPAESLPLGLSIGYKAKTLIANLKDKNSKINYTDAVQSWSSFIQNHEISMKQTDSVNYNDIVVIEHTGGTTGLPKGVKLSNYNINAMALQSVLTGIDMQREHNWLDIMPTFIAYGVGMGLHLPLTIGMETILIPQFDPKKFDELIKKYKPIHMVGVPSYWGTIVNSKKLQKMDLSFMINPTVGGDSMDVALEKKANEFLHDHNCKSQITKGYGMTEVAGGITGTLDSNNEIGSVGSPFVKSVVAIFDPDTMEELGYNEPGEICMTGPNVMSGYYKNEEATSDVIKVHKDGIPWVHSKDIGYINSNGNLYVMDRLKRMVIRYDGFKVFPSLIENVISSHPLVDSCKVVGIPDQDHSQGKLPKAHIVLKDISPENRKRILNEIREMCVQQLPEYMLPAEYQLRDTMPLTGIGKVDYRFLEREDDEKRKVLAQKNKSNHFVRQ